MGEKEIIELLEKFRRAAACSKHGREHLRMCTHCHDIECAECHKVSCQCWNDE